MKLEDNKADELGLTAEEHAFYCIFLQNSSTQFLEEHKMKELIHLIVDIIRKNATVDWSKRDDVKAKAFGQKSIDKIWLSARCG